MQNTVVPVFSSSDLAKFSDVRDFRNSLGNQRYFRVEGVTRIFGRHVLSYIESLSDLLPSFTIAHSGETFHIPRKLFFRASCYFRDLEKLQKDVITFDSFTVQERISKIGLVHFIDTAQGRRLRLETLEDAVMDQVIAVADFFKVNKVLLRAAPLFIAQAKNLSVHALVTFNTRIRVLSHYFDAIFTPFFSAHLQRLIMRSRFVQEDELPMLLTYLKESQLPLALEFRYWVIDPGIDAILLEELSSLCIKKLNLIHCTGVLDLNSFNNLEELKGSNSNFINIHKCARLKLLNIDLMPSQLPESLRELTLRDALPKSNDLPKKIKRLSLHTTLDAAQLVNIGNEKVSSLKITSRSGHLTLAAIRQIESWQLSQLTLVKVSIPPNILQLPSLGNLREATVIECDPETQRWILSSTNLVKLRIRINGSETLDNLPKSIVDLSLDFDGPAEQLRSLDRLRLESLRTTDVRWSEGGLEAVCVLSTLRELSIHVTGDFLPGETSSLTRLVQLNTFSCTSQTSSSCFPTTEVELEDLMKLTALKVLKIRPAQDLVSRLTQLASLEKLVQLDLFGTSGLTWQQLPVMTRLEDLRLRGCRWMSVNSDTSILSNIPRLRHLEIPQLEGDKETLFSKITSLETLILDK
jgi:hypothetical protein